MLTSGSQNVVKCGSNAQEEPTVKSASKLKQFVIVIVIIGVTAWIMQPFYRHTSTPRWASESGRLLGRVRDGLSRYAADHNGKLPASLRELYPTYVDDARVTRNPIVIGGVKMWMTYHRPEGLGDPNVVVAQLRLDPGVKTGYDVRGFKLLGDLHVHRDHSVSSQR
jgi:hypothetical protein